MNRTYSELISIPTYEERFKYLQLHGAVGKETFGFDGYLNQVLYTSTKWRRVRDKIIVRDNGNDLAMDGYPIGGIIYVHHMDPIEVKDLLNDEEWIFDPEKLISVSYNTHLAIHYGDENLLVLPPKVRTANDTVPWRH